MADGDRKDERSGERSRTPAQSRRATRRERVAQARTQKAPPKSQGGERALLFVVLCQNGPLVLGWVAGEAEFEGVVQAGWKRP